MTDSMNKPMTDPRTHTRMDPIPDPMNDLIPNTNIVMLLQFRTLPMFSLNEIVLFAILSVGLALSDETSYFLHNVGAPPSVIFSLSFSICHLRRYEFLLVSGSYTHIGLKYKCFLK